MSLFQYFMAFMLMGGYLFLITIVFAADREDAVQRSGFSKMRHSLSFALMATAITLVPVLLVVTYLFD